MCSPPSPGASCPLSPCASSPCDTRRDRRKQIMPAMGDFCFSCTSHRVFASLLSSWAFWRIFHCLTPPLFAWCHSRLCNSMQHHPPPLPVEPARYIFVRLPGASLFLMICSRIFCRHFSFRSFPGLSFQSRADLT